MARGPEPEEPAMAPPETEIYEVSCLPASGVFLVASKLQTNQTVLGQEDNAHSPSLINQTSADVEV
jgi:hypothetical protein